MDILELLLETDARFLVVGAHALAAHGVARATGDLDIFVRPAPDNAAKVYRALQGFGAPVQVHGLTHEDLTRAGTVYQVGLPPRRIDVITAIDGVDFEEAWAGRTTRSVSGMELCFLGLRELLKNKRAAGRAKDLADVAALQELGLADEPLDEGD
ncbi:MAG: hypothetical protein H6739_19945 [Alphaproteobacteria bacterium]|nr:hypothetical protein [Alphaproteobacteria bacterium]